MKIFLHNFKTWAKPVLHRCGYTYRPLQKDFIREDGRSGRFHAKVLDSKTIDIHYDLYIGWKHVASFHMPMKHNEEKRRIMKKIYYLKTRDLKPEEWRKLQEKYSSF